MAIFREVKSWTCDFFSALETLMIWKVRLFLIMKKIRFFFVYFDIQQLKKLRLARALDLQEYDLNLPPLMAMLCFFHSFSLLFRARPTICLQCFSPLHSFFLCSMLLFVSHSFYHKMRCALVSLVSVQFFYFSYFFFACNVTGRRPCFNHIFTVHLLLSLCAIITWITLRNNFRREGFKLFSVRS